MQWSGLGLTGMPIDRGVLLELEAQIAAIQAGNLARPTAVLAAHVETLNTVFYALIRSGFEYRGSPYQEEKLRLALRVQSQLRATIRDLADLKNPRPFHVQQANIGNAVQVNNCVVSPPKYQNAPNKLLEQQCNEWMDTRTAQAAGSGNSAVEAMGAIDGTQDGRG